MKKLAVITVVAMMMASCGGGSGSGSSSGGTGKSGLSTKGLLGNIPAIYADLALELEVIDKKIKEEMEIANANNYISEKLSNLGTERDNIEKRSESAQINTMGKIHNKNVPFTCSEEFSKLNWKVECKLRCKTFDFEDFNPYINPDIYCSFVAGQDTEVSADNVKNLKNVCYLLLAKDGSIILMDEVTINIPPMDYKKKSITVDKGYIAALVIFLPVHNRPECFANLESIKFITYDEYQSISGEVCMAGIY